MNDPIFEIKKEKGNETYGMFVVSPLEQGYGNTLGNSLRRVMLTSLPGAAATSVKISSVKHQFSSLKGMKEDVVEFVLNLKKVRFSYTGEKPVIAEISVDGPKEVYARDIQVDASVKIANPDHRLAILNDGAKMNAKIQIESGSGYSPADDRRVEEIGLIPLDATFSPVVKVNYKVEETRVGRLTNYDKLVIEVWTDGTMDPEDALRSAAKVLVVYYNQIINPKKQIEEEGKEENNLGPVGRLSVEEIGLPTRVANALIKAGYETVEDLVQAERESLVKVRNLGGKSVEIVEEALAERGLKIT